ncbi:sensor histidine kinase [Novosphingobium aquimarinum]|uniref:sensor histidine kinase n=1 Tax=Novosphingobium aquimarinum TaxID=2682494 RepID=UPI002FC2F9BC
MRLAGDLSGMAGEPGGTPFDEAPTRLDRRAGMIVRPTLFRKVMNETIEQPRVPARLVLASLMALWACYFIVATLRWYFFGYGFEWPVVSRRLTICIISMLLMAALWPLLQLLDHRSNASKIIIVVLGALPVSLALGAINQAVFADINEQLAKDDEADRSGNVRIRKDGDGNLLIDLPEPTAPPSPPQPPSPEGGDQASGEATARQSDTAPRITVKPAERLEKRLEMIADTAFGRYFLVLAWAALYFALAKAEEARGAERREGEFRRAAEAAELRSLRYQVNPHFLFNTLNSLSALVMTGRQDDAEEMIQTLSTFYRHTLSGDPTTDLPLADEIELQQLYLQIESVRFPKRLLIQIDIDAAAADAMVPGMILQPIVENSVKYAVAATREPVTISIEARADGEWLEIVVADNGPGTSGGDPKGFGIGLTNVRDRLETRFGERATLTSGTRSGGGHATTLRLPMVHGRG